MTLETAVPDERAPTSNGPDLDDATLAAYVDGSLSPDEARAVAAKLADDPVARAEVEELRRMLRLVSELPEVAPSPEFTDRVMRKMRRMRAAAAPAGPGLGLAALAFQVLSILVILAVAAVYMMAQLEARPVGAPTRDVVPVPPRPGGEAAPGPVHR